MVKLQENENSISNSEWEVMRIVWTLGHASSAQIIEKLQAKKNWTESTIKTLLRRLVQKDLLATKQDGRRFIYTALVNQTEVMVEAADDFLSRMCDMHKGAVILELLQKAPISKADLQKMITVINKKEKSAPETVPCNCLVSKEHLC